MSASDTSLREPDDPEFEGMIVPSLADRVRAFETWLVAEPCQNDGHCVVLSNPMAMCAPCRLRLNFYHCTYNAEAYEGGPGEVPRRESNALDTSAPGATEELPLPDPERNTKP